MLNLKILQVDLL